MADKVARYPVNSQLQLPDGSLFIYAQANLDLDPGTYVEANPLGKLIKFKGGLRFPKGIVTETTPDDWYTFVLVREGQPPASEGPAIVQAASKGSA